MKTQILSAALVLFAASAASFNFDSEQLQNFKQSYNEQSSQVPGFVGSIIGGERVNLKLETNGTNQTLGVAFDGVQISKINQSGIKDPTMKVWTDQETLSTIIQSSDKYSALREELNKNEIQYETTTVGAGIKMTIVTTLQDLASMIGLSFQP